MLDWLRRRKKVPVSVPSGETVELEGLETWQVTWIARYGEWQGNTSPVGKLFTNEEDARTFANALADAFELVKFDYAIESISVEKIE